MVAIPAGRWVSPSSSKATESNWLESTRWNMTPMSSSISISRRQSGWITRARRASGWACSTRRITSSSAAKRQAGKNGRRRKNCVDSTRITPIVILLEVMSLGVARPAKPTRNSWASIIAFAAQQRLTGYCSGTFSLWRITCVPIRLRSRSTAGTLSLPMCWQTPA